MGDKCESVSLSKAEAPGDIVAVGYIGFIGGLLSALAIAGVAIGGLTNNNKIPVKPVVILASVTAGAMAFWFVRMMTEGKEAPPISYAGFLAIAGLVVAGVFLKKAQQQQGG